MKLQRECIIACYNALRDVIFQIAQFVNLPSKKEESNGDETRPADVALSYCASMWDTIFDVTVINAMC